MKELAWHGCQNTLEDPVLLDWCSNTWCRKCLLFPERVLSKRSEEFEDSEFNSQPGTSELELDISPVPKKNSSKTKYKCIFCETPLTENKIKELPCNEILKSLIEQKTAGGS